MRRAAGARLALHLAALLSLAAVPARAGPSSVCAVPSNTATYSETFSTTQYRDPRSAVAGWGGGSLTLAPKAGAFPSASITQQLGERIYALASGDFNGDGNSDLIALSDTGGCHLDFFAGNGHAALAAPVQVATCSDTTAAVLSAGDIDNDGRLDLVLATAAAPNQAGTVATAQLLHNTATAAGVPQLAAVDISATLQAAALAWHIGGSQLVLFDWDGDGRADLLALSSSGSADQVLLFSAQPSFGIASSPAVLLADAGLTPPFASGGAAASGGYGCPPAVGRGGTVLAVADYNGDGLPDIVTASASDNALKYFVQNADGTLSRSADLPFAAGGPLWGAAGDMDGDGSFDLLIGRSGNDCNGPTGEMWIFFNDGQGGFTLFENRLTVGGVLQFAAVADADNNGTQDIWAGKLTGVGHATYFPNVPSAAVFNPNGLALSRAVSSLDANNVGIVSLQVSAMQATVPSGCSLTLSVSNDGGTSWEQLSAAELAGSAHIFSHFGADMRWRGQFSAPPVTLSGAQAAYAPAAQLTPTLSQLAFAYTTVGPFAYSRSSLAQGVVPISGHSTEMLFGAAFVYPGFVGSLYAYDLSRLSAGTAASGSLERVDTSSAVSLRWEAGALLAGRSGASRSLYTAYPRTTVGADPVTVQTGRIAFSAAEANSGSSTPALATMMGITALSAAGRSALINYLIDGMGDPNGTKLRDPGHSSPAFVGVPSGDPNYLQPNYAAFVQAQAGRAPRVLLGSNDGMLHAFDAATGSEAWGFVPRNLLAKMGTQQGRDPNGVAVYRHGSFVDGSILVQDVFAQGSWRTVALVGQAQGSGLLGNNYYFALDVTDPDQPQPLWEFSDLWGAPQPSCTLANNTATRCTPSCQQDAASCRSECAPYDALFTVDPNATYLGSPAGAIEAEHFDNLSPAPAGGATWSSVAGPLDGTAPLVPPRSSRGAYLQASPAGPQCTGASSAAMAACAQASYRFTVATAGTYYPFFRIYPTTAYDDTVSWGVDGIYVQSLQAGPPSPPLSYARDTWWWTPGTQMALSAGEHTLNLWMDEAAARVDTIAVQGSSVAPLDTAPETCAQDCSQSCTGTCTTTTYTSPSSTPWPQCGVGNQLQCCGTPGGDQYCAPLGSPCQAPESVSGETFSEPAIGQLRIGSNTPKWVAFFASGYNNRPAAPNVGRSLYAVDAYSGQLMNQWSLGDVPYGPSNPSTLANAVPGGVALVDVNDDGFVDHVYVADLEGRVWKVNTFNSASVDSSGRMTNASAYPSCVLFDAGDPNQSGQRIWGPDSAAPGGGGAGAEHGQRLLRHRRRRRGARYAALQVLQRARRRPAGQLPQHAQI